MRTLLKKEFRLHLIQLVSGQANLAIYCQRNVYGKTHEVRSSLLDKYVEIELNELKQSISRMYI